tara:strand:+ start:154 stop:681 length:528 start_codon:yes stop_codon:yes gene_type:complete
MKRRLHIGGEQQSDEWEILNAIPGPNVDHVCNANDLSQFPDGEFYEIYASHIVEHLDYKNELAITLNEWFRIMEPGGRIRISVPDLDVLARIFLLKDELSPDERWEVMRMMFGGHIDKYDYHVVGLNEVFLASFLLNTGFINIVKVDHFGVFDDTSNMKYGGVLISLNLIAEKPL